MASHSTMSTSNAPAPGRTSQKPTPIRRRTLMACKTCRQRKLRCIPSEQPFNGAPCTRCLKRKLTCEYVATSESISPQTPEYSSSDLPPSHSQSQSHGASHAPGYGRGMPPPLPYTLPPPQNQPPRYSGNRYPDLSTTPQHPNYGTGGPSAPAMQGAYPSPGPSHRPHHSASQPGPYDLHAQAYQYLPHHAGSAPPPQQYGQAPMPFFANTEMPENPQFDWPMEDPNFGSGYPGDNYRYD
ncbi:hypothetical protein C8R46DRAFT_1088196 [Mycena filopes]|nr:hypothetical protein C8R46DRAFT_1088196 [Mycena filopes]